MDKIKFREDLERKVATGKLKKINERYNNDICVTDGSKNFNCSIEIDIYTDLEGNNLYRVEQHIDKKRDYHTINIEEYINGFFKY